VIFSFCTSFNTLALPHPATSFLPLPVPVVTLLLSSSTDAHPIVVRNRRISNSFSFSHAPHSPFACMTRRGRTIERREKAETMETKSTNRRLRIFQKTRKVERRRLLRRDSRRLTGPIPVESKDPICSKVSEYEEKRARKIRGIFSLFAGRPISRILKIE